MKNSASQIFLFYLCFGIALGCILNLDAKAQNCTSSNSPAVVQAGFPRNTQVQVYISPNPPNANGFTQSQINAIRTAFGNWQNASGINNSGVTFNFVTTMPPAGTYQWLVGHEQPTVTPGTRAESGVPVTDAAGNAQQAVTVIDPRVTDPAALIDVMAHEIGHPMGFADCNSCTATDSVMGAGNKRSDYWNGTSGRPTSPTNCDSQRLQEANYPYCNPPVNQSSCLWDVNTCSCSLNNGGGGGYYPEGGGFYYYCTPYYWFYYESYDNGETWRLIDVSYAGCW